MTIIEICTTAKKIHQVGCQGFHELSSLASKSRQDVEITLMAARSSSLIALDFDREGITCNRALQDEDSQ